MTHSHNHDEERRIRENALDETLAGTFPASDPPSSLPNPDDDSLDAASSTDDRPLRQPAGQLDPKGGVDAGLIGGDARITVRRQSPDDVGFREIFLSIDGEQVAILRPDETFTVQVKPGPHRLRANNTLFRKTYDLTLRPGENARFVAINKAGFGTFGFMLFLGASPLYLTFHPDR